MKESQKQARVKIAALALARLYPEAASFKNDLFLVPANATQTEIAEAHKRRWQNDFLSRLASDGVVTKVQDVGKIGYIGNQTRINGILENMRDGDGSLLANYLWPNKKIDITDSEISQVLKEKAPAQPSKSNPSEEENPHILGELEGILRIVLENQNTLFTDFADKFSDVSELAKKTGGFNKRLDRLDEGLAELRKVVHANQSVLKPAMQSIDIISNMGVEKFDERMQESIDHTAGLKNSIDNLVLELEKSRKDKVGVLLQKLDSHISEGQSLRDMVLELVSNDN